MSTVGQLDAPFLTEAAVIKYLQSLGLLKSYKWHTIYGAPGEDGRPPTKYMLRVQLASYRFHIFYRGDEDPDPHDHEWDFTTFPLTPYVEEVTTTHRVRYTKQEDVIINGVAVGCVAIPVEKVFHIKRTQVVPAFRRSPLRPAEYTHRVLGRWRGMAVSERTGQIVEHLRYSDLASEPDLIPIVSPGKVYTVIKRSESRRDWGFLKNRDGVYCWVQWQDYLFRGKNNTPC